MVQAKVIRDGAVPRAFEQVPEEHFELLSVYRYVILGKCVDPDSLTLV